jgi:membrane dipeptidase
MVKSIHEDALIVDSLIVSNWGPDVFQSLQRGGLSAINATCAVWENFRQTAENIAQWHQWFAQYSDLIVPVRHTDDIAAAKAAGKVGVILGFQNASPFEDRPDFVRLFKSMGVGVVQITYNNQNLIGSGAYESTDSGLSDFGRMIVDEMNAAGVAVDLSHVGAKTSADAIGHSAKPVCFTHANPMSLKKHVRNKEDGLLRALVDKGGYVGVNLFSIFMPDDANTRIEDITVMLDYLIDLIGDDHIGIGTDLTQGHGADFFRWICMINGQGDLVLEIPEEDQGMLIRKADDYGLITQALEKHGYSEDRVRKIMGLNFVRFLKEAWNEVD